MHNILNCKQLEKSRGAILFAYNTTINYIEIATKTAKLIKHILNLPVSIITDQHIHSDVFDKIIIHENNFENIRIGNMQWRNGNRFLAYNLSPYDETILVDSDYLILDKKLLKLFDSTIDYRIFQNNTFLDLSNTRLTDKMGVYSLDFLWATVILFKKTKKTNLLFNLVKNIQKNYNYYCNLYQIGASNYRNDFAFTIANNIINGYSEEANCLIPWPMISINQVDNLEQVTDFLVIRSGKHNIISPIQSLHILDKEFLMSNKFDNFVQEVLCNLKTI